MLSEGLYEQVINKDIDTELSCTDLLSVAEHIDQAEASGVLSKYVSNVISKGLENVVDNGGDISGQIQLVNRIIDVIGNSTGETTFSGLSVAERAELLLALMNKQNSRLAVNEKNDIVRPETSIAQSSLFTGAIHEPQMFSELKKEIISSNRIDMLVSFIKWSGLRLIIDDLKTFTMNGGSLRIITTSYMGATDVKAIEELRQLPNTSIKVSYDTKTTRLHAKTYVFYRETGFTTAYIGSSNISNAALTSGLEWNVKVTMQDLPETIDKISATFDSYWNSKDFEYYDEGQKERLAAALKSEKYYESNNAEIFTFDIKPYSYQQEILDKLDAERKIRKYSRNLVVAATGTGKTIISALDYKRFRKENPASPCRLLFVAHREEILKQSLYSFRAVLKDANFGDMFVGNYKPDNIDNLFISIQTFNSQNFISKTTPDFYDFIIVDEFHHAAAPTYQKLLEYYKPQILLGLTATPERMDGKSILTYFDNRIAAEIRLPEAIDRKLLCPFQYFGVSDIVDYTQIKWRNGGYDKRELSDKLTIDKAVALNRADHIVRSVLRYVTDIDDVKGLGFCVTVEHADFMSAYFNDHGIKSMFLTGQSPDEDRRLAKSKLVKGEVKFIFVVDIYNEGVDIPEVNTVLFLRPTESLTVFLQQLGRGLRLSEGKECLTVLDFVGQSNNRYNFEGKFNSLLTNTNHGLSHQIKHGFTSLPKGCYIQLEKQAAKYILENIRSSYGNSPWIVSKLADFEEDTGLTPTLEHFVSYYNIDVKSVYKCATFARLCARADVIDNFHEPIEKIIEKAMPRLCTIDSRRLIAFLLGLLPNIDNTDFTKLSDMEQRMMQMFYISIWGKAIEDFSGDEFLDNIYSLADSPIMLQEICKLLKYNFNHIDFIDKPVNLGFDCPLDVYCTYTRDQLLVALGFMKPSTVREGVKWLPNVKSDVFFVTLNKADKDYSPTTMYNDYSVNEELFHWQSQSTTSPSSPTGQRYINHKKQGSKILLFVREYKQDDILGIAAAYTFLGTANYVKHNGSMPMNITWKLDEPIPAKFLKKTNKLMAG